MSETLYTRALEIENETAYGANTATRVGSLIKDIIMKGITEVTYTSLISMISEESLLPGELYMISDYQTIHTIPLTSEINSGETEQIIVVALGNDKLHCQAFSLDYPQDIIYYSPINNQERMPGCTKGYIYRRIDPGANNDLPLDFRNVKFRRWQIEVPDHNPLVTYQANDVVKDPGNNQLYRSLVDDNDNVDLSNAAFWGLESWENGSFVSPTPDNLILQLDEDDEEERPYILPCSSGYMDYYIFQGGYATAVNNHFAGGGVNLLDNCNTVFFCVPKNNQVGEGFTNNTIDGVFEGNKIGDYCSDNLLFATFNDCFIGAQFMKNSISGVCTSNTIGNYFSANRVSNTFRFNHIGHFAQLNNFGPCTGYTTVGIGFKYNYVGPDFLWNQVGSGVEKNYFGNKVERNLIGGRFTDNRIDGDFTDNIIGNRVRQCEFGRYFNGNVIDPLVWQLKTETAASGSAVRMNTFKAIPLGESLDLTGAILLRKNYPVTVCPITGGVKLVYIDGSDLLVVNYDHDPDV